MATVNTSKKVAGLGDGSRGGSNIIRLQQIDSLAADIAGFTGGVADIHGLPVDPDNDIAIYEIPAVSSTIFLDEASDTTKVDEANDPAGENSGEKNIAFEGNFIGSDQFITELLTSKAQGAYYKLEIFIPTIMTTGAVGFKHIIMRLGTFERNFTMNMNPGEIRDVPFRFKLRTVSTAVNDVRGRKVWKYAEVATVPTFNSSYTIANLT